MPYSDYLKTQHWQNTRQRILLKRQGACMICGTDKNIHIHHRRYKDTRGNILFREADHELYTLCGSCHSTWHGIYKTRQKMSIKHIERIKTLINLGANKKLAFQLSGQGQLYRNVINLYKQKNGMKRVTRLPFETPMKSDGRVDVSL